MTAAGAGDGPIFLGGDDRSGTTLLSLMLDSHRDIFMGVELDFQEPADLGGTILECCRLLAAGDSRVQGAGVEARDPAFGPAVQFIKQCRRFGLRDGELAVLIEDCMHATASSLGDWEERCALIERIGSCRRRGVGKRRWGMKIQRAIAQAERFAAVWPGARFLHIVRDGRDVAASHLRGGRSWGYRSITDAANGWRAVVDAVAALPSRLSVFELRYERLVSEPRDVMREVLRFLDLPWDDAVLHHAGGAHALFVEPYGHPSAESARSPVHRHAVGRFRRDLSRQDIAAFEAVAGPALRRLGYATLTP